MTLASSWRARLASSKALILVEMAAVAGVFIADTQHLIIFSKTPYLLVLAALSLWLRAARWRDLGWRIPSDWPRVLLIGLAAGVGIELMELFITQPLFVRLTGKMPDLSDAVALASNWKLFLLALALTWTLAAMGEELVWRGWVFSRLESLFGANRWATIAAVAIANVAFGLAHFPQGITGIAENALDGALLAWLYLATGRSLLAPIIAHGVTDTVDFSLIFTGHYPGL
jgi:uncharacterized protein